MKIWIKISVNKHRAIKRLSFHQCVFFFCRGVCARCSAEQCAVGWRSYAFLWSALASTPTHSCVPPLITDKDPTFLSFTASLAQEGPSVSTLEGECGVGVGQLRGVAALALGQVRPRLISTMHQRLNCWPVWEMSNSWGAYRALLRLPLDNAGWKSLSHLIPFSLDVTRASHFLYPEKEHWPGIFCRTLLHADWDRCSPHKQIRYYVNV